MIRTRYSLLLLPIISLAVLALYLFPETKPLIDSEYFSHEDKPLLTQKSSWRSMTPNINVPPPELLKILTFSGLGVWTERIDQIYWIAGLAAGDGSGRLESAPFPAPRWITLTVSGDLERPGNELYFLREGAETHFPIRVRTGERFWRRVTYALPSDWVGKKIQLIAKAGPRDVTNWFGFSNPRAMGAGAILASQMKSAAFLPAFIAALLLFLLPGLPAAAHLTHLGWVKPPFVLPLAITLSSLVGYLTFWAYLCSPVFGRYFGGAILLGSTVWLLTSLRSSHANRSLLLSEPILTPLALMSLVGLFFVALLYSIDFEVGIREQPRLRFFEFPLTLDNEIPYFFADPLYTGQDVTKTFPEEVPEWRSSDRPPLQSGLILLQLPIGSLFGQPRLYSCMVGCSVQCAWVPAVWCLLTRGGLSRRRAGLALLFVVLTGFTLVNTVFAWPKMLSAALTIFAVVLGLFDREQSGKFFPLSKAILLGLSAALASLGHGGVAFTLLPFGVLLLLPRWFPGTSRLIVAGAVYLALLYPWSLYQRLYDPPGTRLLKLHLAGNQAEGDSETWRDKRPLWQNLLAAYSAVSPREVLANRLGNLKTLFVPAPDQFRWLPHETPITLPIGWAAFRRCDFFCLFWAQGLLNLGWAVALIMSVRRSAGISPVLGVTIPLLSLASILLWVLLMFGPASTIIHQGSYATFLLLFASLAAWLCVLPEWIVYLLLTTQGILFACGWLLTSPANGFGPANYFMIVPAVLFFAALVRVAVGVNRADAAPAPKTRLAA
jgi:hypothetical protein